MKKLFINTDGGSRGNPGPAAIGVVFYDENDRKIYEYKECIGETTNNVAEYQALIRALEILSRSKWVVDNRGSGVVVCRLDSKLVVEQVCGNYKIKQQHLMGYLDQIKTLMKNSGVEYECIHVPRERNQEADRLVNLALDQQKDNNQAE